MKTFNRLIDQLKFEEGLSLKAYLCPAGFKTIGYGHNLDKRPLFDGRHIPDEIKQSQAELILRADVRQTAFELVERWPRIGQLNEARRDACINMAFQLGVSGFMRFEKMREAMLARDWQTAHDQALNSRWAMQTPGRAGRVAAQILSGLYYSFKG